MIDSMSFPSPIGGSRPSARTGHPCWRNRWWAPSAGMVSSNPELRDSLLLSERTRCTGQPPAARSASLKGPEPRLTSPMDRAGHPRPAEGLYWWLYRSARLRLTTWPGVLRRATWWYLPLRWHVARTLFHQRDDRSPKGLGGVADEGGHASAS